MEAGDAGPEADVQDAVTDDGAEAQTLIEAFTEHKKT